MGTCTASGPFPVSPETKKILSGIYHLHEEIYNYKFYTLLISLTSPSSIERIRNIWKMMFV